MAAPPRGAGGDPRPLHPVAPSPLHPVAPQTVTHRHTALHPVTGGDTGPAERVCARKGGYPRHCPRAVPPAQAAPAHHDLLYPARAGRLPLHNVTSRHTACPSDKPARGGHPVGGRVSSMRAIHANRGAPCRGAPPRRPLDIHCARSSRRSSAAPNGTRRVSSGASTGCSTRATR